MLLLQLRARGFGGGQIARLWISKCFLNAFKVPGDGLKSFGGLLLLLDRLLCSLCNLVRILRIFLRIEQLLVGLCHGFLHCIDHAQGSVGVFRGLQLGRIENVLPGCHFDEGFLQLLDTLLNLFLLLGVFLSRSLRVLGLVLKLFGLLCCDLGKLRNRWRKTG